MEVAMEERIIVGKSDQCSSGQVPFTLGQLSGEPYPLGKPVLDIRQIGGSAVKDLVVKHGGLFGENLCIVGTVNDRVEHGSTICPGEDDTEAILYLDDLIYRGCWSPRLDSGLRLLNLQEQAR
jgi:hypothetical protein